MSKIIVCLFLLSMILYEDHYWYISELIMQLYLDKTRLSSLLSHNIELFALVSPSSD